MKSARQKEYVLLSDRGVISNPLTLFRAMERLRGMGWGEEIDLMTSEAIKEFEQLPDMRKAQMLTSRGEKLIDITSHGEVLTCHFQSGRIWRIE